MPESTQQLCAVCSDPADPETAHWLHEPDCGKIHGTAVADDPCRCDAVAHPECCPELECQDIGNGHTIELAARFSVPPWFTAEQVNALAGRLAQYVTWADWPLHADYGPSPEAWYGYDTAYICVAAAEAQVVTETGVDTGAVIWGHGDRCRSCHHIDDDHALDNTERCAVDGCACARRVPYGRLAEIGEPRS